MCKPQHLAMMERLCGVFPPQLSRRARKEARDFFTKDGKLLWPELAGGASGASLSTWLSRYSLLLHASACVCLNASHQVQHLLFHANACVFEYVQIFTRTHARTRTHVCVYAGRRRRSPDGRAVAEAKDQVRNTQDMCERHV